MNTTVIEAAQKTKVHFHIGRGRSFFDGDHKTYIGEVRALSDCFGDYYDILDEDENGNPLPDSEWELRDENGNVILTGRDKIESETGFLDWEGEYNSDIVCYLTDCDEEECQLILDAAEKGEYIEYSILAYVCHVLGKLIARSINVTPTTMEVHTQEDECTILQRDDYSSYSEYEEDEVRELLAEKGFTSKSIDKIIDKMEANEWFKYEE